MTTIYLIRHAEAEGNLYRIAQGQYDSLLTELGRRQAQALGERFRCVPLDAVYASDLHRTRATAAPICISHNLPLHLRADLREIGVGCWEQRTWGDLRRSDREQMENFMRRLDRWSVPGGEAPEALRDRMLRAVEEIAAANVGRTVAVVSHGCAIRVLLAVLEGRSLAELSETPVGGNTAVSRLEADGGTLRVCWRDDCSHLPALGPRRPNGLEGGLYFEPLRLPEQADWFAACVRDAWADAGEVRPWDAQTLLDDARQRPTLLALRENGTPVGAVQFRPDAPDEGRISLYCMAREARARGWGVQLLGQAVRYYRARSCPRVSVSLRRENAAARRFFTGLGFEKTDREDGRVELRLGIAWQDDGVRIALDKPNAGFL